MSEGVEHTFSKGAEHKFSRTQRSAKHKLPNTANRRSAHAKAQAHLLDGEITEVEDVQLEHVEHAEHDHASHAVVVLITGAIYLPEQHMTKNKCINQNIQTNPDIHVQIEYM